MNYLKIILLCCVSERLSFISVLVLLVFVGWFAWNQREIIQRQQELIIKQDKQLIHQTIIMQIALQEYNNEPINEKTYNSPRNYFKF